MAFPHYIRAEASDLHGEEKEHDNTYEGMVLSPLLALFSQAWSANSRHVVAKWIIV